MASVRLRAGLHCSLVQPYSVQINCDSQCRLYLKQIGTGKRTSEQGVRKVGYARLPCPTNLGYPPPPLSHVPALSKQPSNGQMLVAHGPDLRILRPCMIATAVFVLLLGAETEPNFNLK